MKVKLDSGARRPTRAHNTDAGLDLYSMHDGVVRAHQSATFHTGIRAQLPKATAGILLPKSGMMVHHDLLTFGVVDEGYDGEILVHIFNCGTKDYSVSAGDKISQMLIVPILYEPIDVVEEIIGGDRGSHGFGSTGTR